MQLSYKVKKLVFDIMIVNEWIKNGEFDNADMVIVAGTMTQAIMVNFLFKGKRQKIKYCRRLHGKYRYNCLRKWIVFNDSYKNILPWNDTSILWMPNL